MTLAYLDFQIEVTAATAPRYRIAVRSQAGDTHAEIDFPFTDAQLQVELQRLEHAILYARLGTRGRLTPHEEAVRDFGLRFFDFLLPPGDARSLYYECRRVAEFEGKGVRVKLLMHAPQLAAMPWEFLFDPRRRDYLALDPYTPIVRYPELAQRTTPLPVTPPLRILGVIANPTDLPRLDVQRERQQVEAAIRPLVDRGRVQLTWLPGQSWRDLQQWMRPGYGPWHIFHFIGHGEFDQRRDEGRLFLADEQGKAQAISATQLNRLLAFQRGALRLALLNACEGARGGCFPAQRRRWSWVACRRCWRCNMPLPTRRRWNLPAPSTARWSITCRLMPPWLMRATPSTGKMSIPWSGERRFSLCGQRMGSCLRWSKQRVRQQRQGNPL
jgi:hypothetical protein